MPKRIHRAKKSSSVNFFIKFLVLSTILFGLLLFYLNHQARLLKPVDTSVWKAYQNTLGGYTMRYPPDWGYRDIPVKLFDPKDQATMVAYTAYSKVYNIQPDFGKDSLETPIGDPRLWVKKSGGKTLIKIVHEYIVDLSKGEVKYSLKDEGTRVIDGENAMYIITDTEVANPKISDFFYYWIKNDKLYTFSYRSENQQPLEIPEAILATFRFTQ